MPTQDRQISQCHHRQGDVPVSARPTVHFVLIQPDLALGCLKAFFHSPVHAGHAYQSCQGCVARRITDVIGKLAVGQTTAQQQPAFVTFCRNGATLTERFQGSNEGEGCGILRVLATAFSGGFGGVYLPCDGTSAARQRRFGRRQQYSASVWSSGAQFSEPPFYHTTVAPPCVVPPARCLRPTSASDCGSSRRRVRSGARRAAGDPAWPRSAFGWPQMRHLTRRSLGST